MFNFKKEKLVYKQCQQLHRKTKTTHMFLFLQLDERCMIHIEELYYSLLHLKLFPSSNILFFSLIFFGDRTTKQILAFN